jgi:hypothetical protein
MRNNVEPGWGAAREMEGVGVVRLHTDIYNNKRKRKKKKKNGETTRKARERSEE